MQIQKKTRLKPIAMKSYHVTQRDFDYWLARAPSTYSITRSPLVPKVVSEMNCKRRWTCSRILSANTSLAIWITSGYYITASEHQ